MYISVLKMIILYIPTDTYNARKYFSFIQAPSVFLSEGGKLVNTRLLTTFVSRLQPNHFLIHFN